MSYKSTYGVDDPCAPQPDPETGRRKRIGHELVNRYRLLDGRLSTVSCRRCGRLWRVVESGDHVRTFWWTRLRRREIKWSGPFTGLRTGALEPPRDPDYI